MEAFNPTMDLCFDVTADFTGFNGVAVDAYQNPLNYHFSGIEVYILKQ